MSAWFAYHLRRLLRPGLLVLAGLLAALAARGTSAGGDELARAARALARTQAWSVLALLAPFLAARAAAAARPGAHAAWLAGGARRAPLAAGPILAGLAGAALLAGVLLAASEAVLAGGEPVQRLVARPPCPERVLQTPDETLRWSVTRPRNAHAVRLELGLVLGPLPSATVTLELRDGSGVRRLERTLGERGVLELELPPEESGTLELALGRVGEGALLVLGADALELVRAAGSERRAALVFALHAALALGALVALAQLCAQVLAPALSAALAAALALAAAHAGLAPWSPLGAAWGELALGREPAPPAAAGVLVTLALALAAAGLLARHRQGGAP